MLKERALSQLASVTNSSVSCVRAMHSDEALDIVAPVPAAPLADRERRLADVGQGEGAVAGHGGLFDPGLALSGVETTVM
jgi:hypothetical protein